MAIELMTCGSCGAKNAASRTVCLSCGSSLIAPARTTSTDGQGGAANLSGTEPLLKRRGQLVKTVTLNQAIKLSLIAGVLLVSFSVFYYLIIFLPRKEQTKMESQRQAEQTRQELEQARVALQQQEIIAKELKELSRSAELDVCLSDAYEDYKLNWANNCRTEAGRVSLLAQECFRSGLSWNLCTALQRTANASSSCSLPSNLAGSVNAAYRQRKEECFKRYPQR